MDATIASGHVFDTLSQKKLEHRIACHATQIRLQKSSDVPLKRRGPMRGRRGAAKRITPNAARTNCSGLLAASAKRATSDSECMLIQHRRRRLPRLRQATGSAVRFLSEN